MGQGMELILIIKFKINKRFTDAFNLAKSFINNENVALILGDNFFYGQSLTQKLEKLKNINLEQQYF